MTSSPNKIIYKFCKCPLKTTVRSINKHIDGLRKHDTVFSWSPFIFLIRTAFKASTHGKTKDPEMTIKMKKEMVISSWSSCWVYLPYPMTIRVTPTNEMHVNNKSVSFIDSFRRRYEMKTVAIGVRLRLTAWKVSEMYFTSEYCMMFSIEAETHRTSRSVLLPSGTS